MNWCYEWVVCPLEKTAYKKTLSAGAFGYARITDRAHWCEHTSGVQTERNL